MSQSEMSQPPTPKQPAAGQPMGIREFAAHAVLAVMGLGGGFVVGWIIGILTGLIRLC